MTFKDKDKQLGSLHSGPDGRLGQMRSGVTLIKPKIRRSSMFRLLCPHLRRNSVRFMVFLFSVSCFKSFLWVKIFEWIWATKGTKSWYLKVVFLFDQAQDLGSGAALWGFCGTLSWPHPWCQPARGWPNNGGSHEWPPRPFLKGALTGRLQGPEETQGSSGSSSEQQGYAARVTCGQGIRGSCVQSLPWQD